MDDRLRTPPWSSHYRMKTMIVFVAQAQAVEFNENSSDVPIFPREEKRIPHTLKSLVDRIGADGANAEHARNHHALRRFEAYGYLLFVFYQFVG